MASLPRTSKMWHSSDWPRSAASLTACCAWPRRTHKLLSVHTDIGPIDVLAVELAGEGGATGARGMAESLRVRGLA